MRAERALRAAVLRPLKDRLRGLYRFPFFAGLLSAYFRYARPLLRRVWPLYGSTAMLALTYRCQCRCVHCGAAGYPKRPESELTEDEVLRLLGELARLGAEGVYFFGGEPLLVPALARYVRRAKEVGLSTALDTNGLLLDEERARALKEAGLDVVRVSIDSPEAAEHDRLRGVEGLHRRALEGVRICRRLGLECHLSAYATREGLREGRVKALIDEGRSLGARVRLLSPVRSGRLEERGEVALTTEELGSLRALLGADAYWEAEFVSDPATPFFCGTAVANFFFVSPHGEVQPCAYMPVGFGSVRREPLARIARRMWSSDMFRVLDGGTDCPMNSPSFRERYGPLLERRAEDGSHPAVPFERASSPNDPAEWDRWADAYADEVDWMEGLHDAEVLRLVGPGARVLDLGCGTGRLAEVLAEKGCRVDAVDSSERMLERARRRLGGREGARLLSLDLERGEWPEGPYDLVVALSTMHHVRALESVAARMRSALAPGGRVLIVDSLSGRGLVGRLVFFSQLLRVGGPLRFARAVLSRLRGGGLLERHQAREIELGLEDFRRRYEELLPGASVSVRHGLFGYLLWSRP
ncbi:MAG: radical SAM protein [Elusimicrobiota bacterium]|jgi:MoaA/NifB/PqqE/SkfB family radical SAM enzyme